MARLDWVHKRLQEWGRWRTQRESSGLGYPKQSAFARLAPSGGGWGSAVPVDSVEASRTEEAVRSLLLSRSHLYRALELIYVRQVGIRAAALQMGRAESTVKANLEQADHAIAAWLEAQAAARAGKQAAKGSFTT